MPVPVICSSTGARSAAEALRKAANSPWASRTERENCAKVMPVISLSLASRAWALLGMDWGSPWPSVMSAYWCTKAWSLPSARPRARRCVQEAFQRRPLSAVKTTSARQDPWPLLMSSLSRPLM